MRLRRRKRKRRNDTLRRHCERSEAIHLSACGAMDCFASLATTGRERSAPFPSPLAGEGSGRIRTRHHSPMVFDPHGEERVARLEPCRPQTGLHPSRRARCALLRMRSDMCDVLCDCPTGKSLLIFRNRVKPRNQKYSASRSPQITRTTPPIPRPQEGRIAIVTDVGCGERWPQSAGRADRFSQGGLQACEREPRADERRLLRTAKPCGPGTRCWCQAGGGFGRPNRVSPRPSIRRRWRQEEFVSRESAV
jgi:hypothetical protein